MHSDRLSSAEYLKGWWHWIFDLDWQTIIKASHGLYELSRGQY